MVGVPRSTGCQLCVKRRVKCDQCRPFCNNCIKYGQPCPGYDRAFKFVGGKHHVRSRLKADPSSRGSSSGPAAVGAIHATAPSTTPLPPSFDFSSRPEPRLQLQLYYNPPEDRSQAVRAIVQRLEESPFALDLLIVAPYFKEVPQRLGHQATLDSAVAAFALHLLGKARQDDTTVRQSRSVYSQALRALQKSLDHPVEWKSSETLCATMILCQFELWAGTVDDGSWMKHAAGVSRLLQQRGPEAYNDDWDRSMLLSFRNIIAMQAFSTLQDCFLAGKPWERLLTDRPAVHSGADATLTELRAIADRYGIYLARMPGIMRRGFTLREARRHGMPVDPADVARLHRRAEKLRSEVAALFDRYTALAPAPTEVPSRDPGSIFETVLWYSNVWHGCFRMSCWATLLVMQLCLVQCDVDYNASNRELTNNILRSVECVAAGVMGPLRVGYPLRVAYDSADLQTQLWITSTLSGFEKRYAAAGVRGYPKPGTNSPEPLENSRPDANAQDQTLLEGAGWLF